MLPAGIDDLIQGSGVYAPSRKRRNSTFSAGSTDFRCAPWIHMGPLGLGLAKRFSAICTRNVKVQRTLALISYFGIRHQDDVLLLTGIRLPRRSSQICAGLGQEILIRKGLKSVLPAENVEFRRFLLGAQIPDP